MALFGAAAVTWFVSVKPADLPVWPAVVFTVITAAAFYGMVAPLRDWPPFKPEPVEARTIARGRFLQDAGRQMLERFREGDGWDLDELRRRFRAHERGIAEGTRGPELEEDDKRKALTWDGEPRRIGSVRWLRRFS